MRARAPGIVFTPGTQAADSVALITPLMTQIFDFHWDYKIKWCLQL